MPRRTWTNWGSRRRRSRRSSVTSKRCVGDMCGVCVDGRGARRALAGKFEKKEALPVPPFPKLAFVLCLGGQAEKKRVTRVANSRACACIALSSWRDAPRGRVLQPLSRLFMQSWMDSLPQRLHRVSNRCCPDSREGKNIKSASEMVPPFLERLSPRHQILRLSKKNKTSS